MTDRIKAWQCIGCGRIEVPETCVGVCEFKRIELGYAFEHDAALGAERAGRARLEAFLARLVHTRPREGEWERSYRALQEEARRLLLEDAGAAAPPDCPQNR